MELVIKELDEINLKDVGRCDGEFVIDSQLVLHAENNQIHYTIIDRPPTKKRYDQAEVDYAASVDPNFANLTDMTPLNPPFEGGRFSPPPREGELEEVNLDLLSLHRQSGQGRLSGLC
jgi:hypothetical protein